MDQAAAPYLRIERLSKRFGAFTALKDISLSIARGEFVCFLGPSGCGKTTLLRAIAGLDIQSTGSIHQDGRDVSALPPSERDFGIVFQSYALFPNLTVARNVGYGLVSRKMARAAIDARVAELLALVGLPDAGRKFPAQLSGGQQQRVALARALAPSPGLLLLDEPLSALDARVRVRLREEIKSVHQRLGVTTVMVTHDQEEALTMADRIVVMNHGVIEQVGAPMAIYGEPRSAFVADFVGTMNFLDVVRAGPAKVRLGGAELAVSSVQDVADGKARVSIRPEEVIVQHAGGGAGNAVAATVHSATFLGPFWRVTLRPEGAEDTTIIADIAAGAARALDLSPGGAVLAVLPAEKLHVLSG
jgi:iron(III) transport system ATP-binding protein